MRSRWASVEVTRTKAGTARPYPAMLGIEAVANSTYGTAVNDADKPAAAAAAPAVRQRVVRSISRFQVSRAALSGNSHTAAASELRV